MYDFIEMYENLPPQNNFLKDGYENHYKLQLVKILEFTAWYLRILVILLVL